MAAEASVPGDLDSRIQSEAHTLIKVAAADSHEHRMLAEILYIRLPLSSFGESRPATPVDAIPRDVSTTDADISRPSLAAHPGTWIRVL